LKRRGVVPAVQAVDITPAADLQTAKLHALEADNRKLLRANTAMREAADRDAVLADVIRRSAEDSFAATVPPAPRARKVGKLTPQEFLAHVSDAHYGEVVNPELTNGIAYSPDTAIARIDYLAGRSSGTPSCARTTSRCCTSRSSATCCRATTTRTWT
jgi:hypothetical protein